MRKYEAKLDRALIDLRDERDDLSIQINLLQDRDDVDCAELGAMQRNLGLIDQRIARHKGELEG